MPGNARLISRRHCPIPAEPRFWHPPAPSPWAQHQKPEGWQTPHEPATSPQPRGRTCWCPLGCFSGRAGENLLFVQDMGSLVPASFQQCLVLNHLQSRNIRHFQSSVVCAEQTSGQSPWPACSTVTASHHATQVSERRDGGQVHFSPQQHIFQGSPIKPTHQGHEKKLS